MAEGRGSIAGSSVQQYRREPVVQGSLLPVYCQPEGHFPSQNGFVPNHRHSWGRGLGSGALATSRQHSRREPVVHGSRLPVYVHPVGHLPSQKGLVPNQRHSRAASASPPVSAIATKSRVIAEAIHHSRDMIASSVPISAELLCMLQPALGEGPSALQPSHMRHDGLFPQSCIFHRNCRSADGL